MFTPRQQGIFRPLVQRAWASYCEREGREAGNRTERDNWYRGELLTVIGVDSTKDCDQVRDFDSIVAHFAILANDAFWIDRTSKASEIRMRYWIGRRLSDLDKLTNQEHHWDYVVGIYRHMNLPADMEDCPAQLLWKVFQALDTHVRRIFNSRTPAMAS